MGKNAIASKELTNDLDSNNQITTDQIVPDEKMAKLDLNKKHPNAVEAKIIAIQQKLLQTKKPNFLKPKPKAGREVPHLVSHHAPPTIPKSNQSDPQDKIPIVPSDLSLKPTPESSDTVNPIPKNNLNPIKVHSKDNVIKEHTKEIFQPIQHSKEISKPIQQHSNDILKPFQHPKNIPTFTQEPIKKTSKVIEEPLKNISNVIEEPIKNTSKMIEEPIKETSKVIEEPIKKSFKVIQEPIKESSKVMEEPIKETSKGIQEPCNAIPEVSEDIPTPIQENPHELEEHSLEMKMKPKMSQPKSHKAANSTNRYAVKSPRTKPTTKITNKFKSPVPKKSIGFQSPSKSQIDRSSPTLERMTTPRRTPSRSSYGSGKKIHYHESYENVKSRVFLECGSPRLMRQKAAQRERREQLEKKNKEKQAIRMRERALLSERRQRQQQLQQQELLAEQNERHRFIQQLKKQQK